MPVAVMAESAFSFKKLLDQCENQELEVAVCVALGETSGRRRCVGFQGNGTRACRLQRALGGCGSGSWMSDLTDPGRVSPKS
jgi:hypothetical protein